MKRIHALALAAILVGEFVLLHTMTARHHAWIYPRWFDQVQYLSEAYRGFEQMRAQGFMAGVKETLTNIAPQGTLHDFWALLVFSVSQPSRSAALAVNFLAFLVLQAVTFLAVRRISGSRPIAWMAVALLAALQCLWSGGSASAVDFRLDWMAACVYGIALGVAIAGNGFESTRWAVAFGATVGVVLLTRHLTVIYFALIYPLLLLVTLMTGPDRWRRSGRLLLSGLVALGMAAPFFWLNRQAIYAYYWIGHMEGPERALRDSHLGPIASVKWIFSELFSAQIGWVATGLGLGAAGALLILGRIPRTRVDQASLLPFPLQRAWGVTLVFLAAPAAVLSWHALKATQPVSILAPVGIWLGVLGCVHLARRVKPGAVAATSGAVVLVGAMILVTAVTRPPHSRETVRTAQTVNALADYVYFRAEECGLTPARFAATWILDGINAQSFRVLGYERHHHWLQIDETLPTGLLEPTPEIVLQQLAQSDFVCLAMGPEAEAGQWPFNRQMINLRPVISQWCETNLRRVGVLEAVGMPMVLYERSTLTRVGSGPGVDFASLLKAAADSAPGVETMPPAVPRLLSRGEVLWSTQAECSYLLRAAYSPVQYRVAGLPEGLQFDAVTGKIHGHFPRAGTFPVQVTATNAVGAITGSLTFQVADEASFGRVRAPATAAVGAPVEITYEAFDAAGKLDLIDVVDVTAGKQLDRLPVGEGQRQSWQGRYQATFSQPGPRTLLLRFTRFDPGEKVPYTYFDQSCEINIVP